MTASILARVMELEFIVGDILTEMILESDDMDLMARLTLHKQQLDRNLAAGGDMVRRSLGVTE